MIREEYRDPPTRGTACETDAGAETVAIERRQSPAGQDQQTADASP
jgi:hypothetical protein